MNKPELLLPVGNTESFYAAIEGGANAIYLGLKNFNARGRAANFSNYQFLLLLKEAEKHKVKVYVTLNTVIKNKELSELLNTLWFLSKTSVSAVIIQDWGVYFLIKKYFPKMKIHASTQMANHNSLGLDFSKKLDFERVILARELTFEELEIIQKKPALETEIFVHGALCYSFSGMCLFSSYIGGAGANRGICTQPCRRFYKKDDQKKQFFSLKDNQLVNLVPEFVKMNVSSLKVEGRLKSAEYVYQVAKAYRKVLDEGNKAVSMAVEELKLDMGREKTQWFYAKQVNKAIASTSNNGWYIGKVSKIKENAIYFFTNEQINKGNRLRIRTNNDNEQVSVKINEYRILENGEFEVLMPQNTKIKVGNEIFLAGGWSEKKFPSKLKGNVNTFKQEIPFSIKRNIHNELRKLKPPTKQTIFIRINSNDWLKKINLNEIDQLILQFNKTDWENFNYDAPFLQKNKHKIWIEFPSFIGEKSIGFYKILYKNLSQKGFNNFSISHLSQKEFLTKKADFICNENVYCYNDAASNLLFEEGAKYVTSPFENEFDNLLSGANRNIIIPMFYYPKLFFSRQPIGISETFENDQKQAFRKFVQNGITIVVPENPVALFQYTDKLKKKGFRQFLIDLSFEKPSKHRIKTLTDKFKKSEQIQPSTTFNFKKGLK